ncbi:MAG: phosphatidylserine decarboxylase [Gammaproteobacteria bacterium]
MAVSRHSVIAPEGWTYISLLLLASVVAQIFFSFWAILVWLLFFASVYLFRDPHRKSPAIPLAIVSPVSGTVTEVAVKQDSFLQREAHFIQIKMPFYTIFSVRSITEGKVMQQWHQMQEYDDKTCPCYSIWIQTDEMDDVILVLRPGRWLNQIKSYFITGERVGQGHRMGYILFGTCIDVYVPKSSTIEAVKGLKVSAGTNILAHLVHN